MRSVRSANRRRQRSAASVVSRKFTGIFGKSLCAERGAGVRKRKGVRRKLTGAWSDPLWLDNGGPGFRQRREHVRFRTLRG